MTLPYKTYNGFTLAELLIGMVILAEIATFTIPKILISQQNNSYNAISKESAATIAAGYNLYKISNTVTSSTGIKDITPYMNYVAIDTTSSIDNVYGQGSESCNTTLVCIRLHNGAVLAYVAPFTFGGTNTTNAVFFHLDPDGRVTDGTTNGSGKSVPLFLYTSGRLTDEGNIQAGTHDSNGVYTANSNNIPPWFNW